MEEDGKTWKKSVNFEELVEREKKKRLKTS
jgi:hypothetical protein